MSSCENRVDEREVFHQLPLDPNSEAHRPHYKFIVTWILKSALAEWDVSGLNSFHIMT